MPRHDNVAELSAGHLGIHLSRTADIAMAEGRRSDAELLVSAIYAAFSDDDPVGESAERRSLAG